MLGGEATRMLTIDVIWNGARVLLFAVKAVGAPQFAYLARLDKLQRLSVVHLADNEGKRLTAEAFDAQCRTTFGEWWEDDVATYGFRVALGGCVEDEIAVLSIQVPDGGTSIVVANGRAATHVPNADAMPGEMIWPALQLAIESLNPQVCA